MNVEKAKPTPMIRSLVAPAAAQPVKVLLADETLEAAVDEDVAPEKLKPRRNLPIEKLEQAWHDDQMMWIDVVNPEDEEIDWLENLLHLSPAVASDLRREDRRPSMLVYNDYLFLSLFQPHIQVQKQVANGGGIHVRGKEIHCLIGEHYFVTVRRSDAKAVDEAYDRVAQNADVWHRGVAYFLYLTAQHVVDAYYPLLDRISNLLNDYEEQMMLGGRADQQARRPVYRVKQQLIHLRQMIAPQREVLSNVIGEQRLAADSETRDLFRHLYERLMRVYDVIDSQRDLSSNVLDMISNQESRSLVEVVNRLTIFSMVFLPLTFFTNLFELGFVTTMDQVILPISGGLLFVIVIGMMIGSASFMIIYFKRRRWL